MRHRYLLFSVLILTGLFANRSAQAHSLNELIALHAQSPTQLELNQIAAEQAAQQIATARSLLLPSVNLALNLSHSRAKNVNERKVINENEQSRATTQQGTLSLTQPLYNATSRAAIDIAQVNQRVTEEQMINQKVNQRSDLLANAVQLFFSQYKVELLDEVRALLDLALLQTEQQVQAGTASKDAVLNINSQIAQNTLQRLQLLAQEQQLVQQITLLLEQPIGRIEASHLLQIDEVTATNDATFLALKIQALATELSSLQIKQTQASRKPTADLSLEWSFNQTRGLELSPVNDTIDQVARISVSAPIFQAGASAQIALAETDFRRATTEHARIKFQLEQQLELINTTDQSIKSQLAVIDDQILLSEDQEALDQQRFQSGRLNELALVAGQLSRKGIQSLRADLLASYWQNLIAAYRLTGDDRLLVTIAP